MKLFLLLCMLISNTKLNRKLNGMITSLSERERELLTLLAEDSTISVNDISASLNVSAVTIRHDLNSLSDKGFIIRTRGGALPTFHPNILSRQREQVDQKAKIAKAAAGMVQDGDTIMIEAGTTLSLIARYFLGKRDIHIVTSSTLIIPYARINPAIHLTVVGGSFRPLTESLVGPVALKELEQFHVKYAFVGTDGFSMENGLTTHLVEGAEILKKMASQAQKTICVADSSKYGKAGFVKVLPLSEISILITDSNLKPDIAGKIEKAGVEVLRIEN